MEQFAAKRLTKFSPQAMGGILLYGLFQQP